MCPHRTAAPSALAQRAGDRIAGAVGQPGAPRGDLAAHTLEIAQRHVAERRGGIAEPLAQALDGPGPDGGRVPVEEQRHELGEREVGHGGGLAA
jgi:hypothetical protein